MRLTELVHTYKDEIRTSMHGRATPQTFFHAISQGGFDVKFNDFVEAERMLFQMNERNFHRINVGIARAYMFYHRKREESAFDELIRLYVDASRSPYLPVDAKKTLFYIVRNEEAAIRQRLEF